MEDQAESPHDILCNSPVDFCPVFAPLFDALLAAPHARDCEAFPDHDHLFILIISGILKKNLLDYRDFSHRLYL